MSNTTINNAIHAYDGDIIPDYPIEFNKMDLVRFDNGNDNSPTYFFKPENEFTIVDVRVPDNPSATNRVIFKVDREVPSFLTGSNNSLQRYIFSKRVTDETNIIIQHQKKPGQTSGGIAKNSNLLLSIDNQIANIVSNLKSKIFSTVLTS